MENIFITGATGFIGANLALYLAEKGHIIHALHRANADTSNIIHKNIKLFTGDICDVSSIEKAINGCSGVFHIAAYAKQWNKDKNKFYDVNYQGTLNVLQAAQQHEVKKIVVTSTAGVIGPSTNQEVVNEDTIRTVGFFFDYEKTKWMAEEKIQEFVSNGMNISIVNPTRVYGPGLLSESNGVTTMIKKYYHGKWHMIPGNGTKIGNYVFIDDVVAGHYSAYTKGVSGERYILGGENISYNELFNKLNEIIEDKHYLIKIPAFLMRFIARVNMILFHITGKPPFLTPGSAKRFLFHWNVSSEKAIKQLGYNPIPFSQGAQKTIDWINET